MDQIIKEEQAKLKAMGFYDGPLDGIDGAATQTARAKLQTHMEKSRAEDRDAAIRSQQLDVERMKAETARAETERQRISAERAEKRKAASETPYEQARQVGLFLAPSAAGLPFGYKKGAKITEGVKNAMEANAKNLSALADEVRAGRISPSAARATATELGLLRSRPSLAPLLLGLGLAGGGYAQRALAPKFTENEIGQDVIRGLGGLESGVGTGVAVQQTFARPTSYSKLSASDVASIRPDGPRGPTPTSPSALAAETRPGLPAPSEPTPTPDTPQGPKPGTKAYMQQQARDLGIKGASRMTKAEIAEKLAGAMKEHGGRRTVAKRIASAAGKTSPLLAPLLAGGIAYDAATSDAEAAGLSPSDARMRGLPTGAAAGAGTAGAIYGLSKAGPAVTRALGRVVPPVAAGMTAYDVGNMAYGDISSQMAPTAEETSARDELSSIEDDLTSGDPMRVSAAKRSLAAMFRSETPEGERSLVERVTNWPADRYAAGLERQADELMPLPERNPVRADEMEIAAMRDRQAQQEPWSSWVDPEEKFNEVALPAQNADRQRSNPTAQQMLAQALRQKFSRQTMPDEIPEDETQPWMRELTAALSGRGRY